VRYIYLILFLIVPLVAFSDTEDESWVTQFRYTNGWGQFEVIWVTSEGNSGYANLGDSPGLPCQFQLPEAEKEDIVAKLNKAIKNLKPAPNLGEESFSCDDETRVSINVSHKPKENGVVGFERRMSIMPQCNNFSVDDNLLSAAKVAYGNIKTLPDVCKINPLK